MTSTDPDFAREDSKPSADGEGVAEQFALKLHFPARTREPRRLVDARFEVVSGGRKRPTFMGQF